MMTLTDLFSLEGKTALVTGGATGIGFMAAHGLMQAGAKVLIASRKEAACIAAAEELNAMGTPGFAIGFAGDVGSEDGVAALVADVKSHTDQLNILMNNAGTSWGAPLEEFPYMAWDKVMSVNVTGLFALTQALLPLLRASATDDDPARVINVGSLMGDQPLADGPYSYAASKAAVHHLTRVLANELAEYRITVNAIAPGPFVSKMTSFVAEAENGQAKIGAKIPLGRMGRAEDIAGTVLYLSGLGGAYITGAILPVSGGAQVDTVESALKVE
jgi:NAD(P)-dependent dehydrogenase (short-subunit alcohol dehydrogenase family)